MKERKFQEIRKRISKESNVALHNLYRFQGHLTAGTRKRTGLGQLRLPAYLDNCTWNDEINQ